MNVLSKGILVGSVLVLGATGLMADNASLDHWYRAKYGRPSPAEEARRREELANTAFREDRNYKEPANFGLEQRYRAKYGRNSPVEEARLRTELQNTAFRQSPELPPSLNFADQFHRAKLGRSLPIQP